MAELEQVVAEKVKPVLDKAMKDYIGATISELETDISDKIKHAPFLDFEIDTKVNFKKAKQSFKKFYLTKLLKLNFGNVEEVSKKAAIDRRSVHRLISDLKINVIQFREEKSRYEKQDAIKDIIEDSLSTYKTIIKPSKIQAMYKKVPALSKEIANVLPEKQLTLTEAETEFEKEYIKKALSQNNYNISKTARIIGLRFETLHRKLKSLNINAK